MMKKVGIIGTGACGSNILLTVAEVDERLLEDEFITEEDMLFKLQAINSTEFDNTFIKHKDVFTKIIGGRGCGKSRLKSKKLFKANSAELVDDLVKELHGCEYVVVVVGLGGGTGSGQFALTIASLQTKSDLINPELAKLDEEVIFIGIGSIPTFGEDPIALKNSIDSIKEVNTLGIAYMLPDNSSIQSTSIKDVYEMINKSISEDLRVIRGDYNSVPSKISNMDYRDCSRLFSTPGLMTISKIAGIKEVDLDKMTFDELILKSIKDSYNVQMEKDKVIGKIGIIMNITENMVNKYDESFSGLLKEVGKTPFVFKHVNIVENEAETSIITILTGLSIPDSKLEELSEVANSAKEDSGRVTESKIDEIQESTSWMEEEEDDSKKKKKESMEDVLNRF